MALHFLANFLLGNTFSVQIFFLASHFRAHFLLGRTFSDTFSSCHHIFCCALLITAWPEAGLARDLCYDITFSCTFFLAITFSYTFSYWHNIFLHIVSLASYFLAHFLFVAIVDRRYAAIQARYGLRGMAWFHAVDA